MLPQTVASYRRTKKVSETVTGQRAGNETTIEGDSGTEETLGEVEIDAVVGSLVTDVHQ